MKKNIIAITTLVSFCLMGNITLASYDDDCADCEEQGFDEQEYHVTYCKIQDVRQSDKYNKTSLEVSLVGESESKTLVFYNTSEYILNQFYSFEKKTDDNYNDWVDIFYTVGEDGRCHALLVRKAMMNTYETPVPIFGLILFIILFFLLLTFLFIILITGA